MKKQTKPIKKEIHTLSDDCRSCAREIIGNSPLVRDLYEARGYTLLSVRSSTAYLLKMTEVIADFVAGTTDDDKQKALFDEYFTDVKTIISMYGRMRAAWEEKRKEETA